MIPLGKTTIHNIKFMNKGFEEQRHIAHKDNQRLLVSSEEIETEVQANEL